MLAVRCLQRPDQEQQITGAGVIVGRESPDTLLLEPSRVALEEEQAFLPAKPSLQAP